MPQEALQREVHDVSHFLVREDEDSVRRTLDRVVPKQVLQQFESDFRFQLLFEHAVEDVVEDGQHGGHLLIAVLVLLAESVVHVVKVQSQQLNLAWRLIWSQVYNRFQVEDFGQHSSLIRICPCLFQALCLVLVQSRVQEELLLHI